jgi:hypothetical protein
VAEHVLAAARYAATGHIGLAPAPGRVRDPAAIPEEEESVLLAQ